ncbi:hypothetical protein RhiirA5_434930 [Rhizophagus irregularis]|uniref:Uncharacterized protein n=1 Tax=Rhizophagus irregularis TaxID=588596 RepID=A0A2N0NP95_9GLOM|nr:hypothetical protein RhiirA5_434930 [Rhizophagus irregularis]GET52165.1 hypothetical protein RIR_jg30220.t1 [Rhizophagus irregularis DAOM 181602=DAOM 197198]
MNIKIIDITEQKSLPQGRFNKFQYTVINPVELENTIAVLFYKAEITKDTFQINDKVYKLKICAENLSQETAHGRNLPMITQVQEDWDIYHMMQESEVLNISNIQLEAEKVVPIGKLEKTPEREHIIITEEVRNKD